VKYLVAPKLAALFVGIPALTVLADLFIALGGWLANSALGFTTNFFLENFRDAFSVGDLFIGLGKAVLFAFLIGIIASDEGLSQERRVAAIGEAATRAVVFCMIGVLSADTLINAVFYFIPRLV
jgi:phospholipid/cholesterol/gamma-HCH transport system permease protein